jgi:hypothetical protein
MLTMNPLQGAESSSPTTLAVTSDFRGRTPLIKLLRHAVSALLSEAGCDPEGQNMAIMVAQELAENLVKYSQSAPASFSICVQRCGTDEVSLDLETVNDASHEEISRVQALLSEAGQRSDVESLYRERIATSSSRPRSELGLLRILTEGGMTLSMRTEGEQLRLRATSVPLSARALVPPDPLALAATREGSL